MMMSKFRLWVAGVLGGFVAVSGVLFLLHEADVRDHVANEFDAQILSELTRNARDQIRQMTKREQIDGWFHERESEINRKAALRGASIRLGQEKGVEWASSTLFQSDLAIVYIHGFSASRLEIDPVITEIAQRVHANVVFTRLSGHGLSDGEDFAEVRARDWAIDVEEAIEVGRRIGRRVAVIAMSTGAPLALAYVARHDVEIRNEKQLASLILLSPNYDPAGFGTSLLSGRTGRFFAKVLLGSHRQFRTENELHAKRWTSRYRSEGLAAMMTAVDSVRYLEFSKIAVPTLTVYSPGDDVVSVSEIKKRSSEFVKPSETIVWERATRHELASAAFTPERRFELEELIQNWLQKF